MNEAQQIKALEQLTGELLENNPGFFLVEVRVLPVNNVKVFIDADNGVAIDQLVGFNRKMYKQIEERNLFPGGIFSLEVSSPGLDEPLKLHRQFVKNIGRGVEVLKNDGIKIEGKLLSASEKEIVVEEEKRRNPKWPKPGKKNEAVQHIIPLEEIKTTKIQITFQN